MTAAVWLRQLIVFCFVLAMTYSGITFASHLLSVHRMDFWSQYDEFTSRAAMSQAEVETVLKNRLKKVRPRDIKKLAREIVILCEKYQFTPSLVLSLIHKESSFRTDALSKVGAIGLMQVLPSTAKYISKKYGIKGYKGTQDLKNPVVNVRLGIAYLSYLREKFSHPNQYIAAYNLGPARLKKKFNEGDFHVENMRSYVYGIRDGMIIMRLEGSVPRNTLAATRY